ncbi:hypothetical protein GCM10009738_76440 [Kitasatospora viridis]
MAKAAITSSSGRAHAGWSPGERHTCHRNRPPPPGTADADPVGPVPDWATSVACAWYVMTPFGSQGNRSCAYSHHSR